MDLQLEQRMLTTAASIVKPGMIINLGFGLPTKLMAFVMNIPDVFVHAENGILGLGPPPAAGQEQSGLINPAGEAASAMDGCSYFDSSHSFSMIRRGCIDIAFLGALQVGSNGDLASWKVPGARISGMGGARELAYGAKSVVVLMNHTDRHGHLKMMHRCTYPLTASGVVHYVITEKGFFHIQNDDFQLVDSFEMP